MCGIAVQLAGKETAVVTASNFSGEVRFGDFHLDLRTGELSRDHILIKLQPQPAKILVLLVSRAGETVSRQELAEQVWGAETFVDFEQGLNFAIRQIRAALKDERRSSSVSPDCAPARVSLCCSGRDRIGARCCGERTPAQPQSTRCGSCPIRLPGSGHSSGSWPCWPWPSSRRWSTAAPPPRAFLASTCKA